MAIGLAGCKLTERAVALSVAAGSGLVLDVAMAADRLVAVGEHGRVVFSDDRGGQWQRASTPVREVLTAVAFADERHGWAVGHGPVVLHTADRGATWVEQSIASDKAEPLFDVVFRDARTGIAVGAFGQIWRTEDGGQRWESVSLHEQGEGELTEPMGVSGVPVADAHLYGIACFPQPGCAVLFAVGEGGVMLRSDDAGKRWQYVDSGTAVSFFGIVANAQRLLAFGMFGRAIVSEDGGETWSEIETDTERSLFAGTWLPDGGAVLVGNDGVGRHYEPGGDRTAPLGYADRDTLTAFVPLGSDAALLAGDMGFVRMPLSFAVASRVSANQRSN
ncbi:YCF48-related protein [Aromatoleum toluclasticum]|uniref:YCF48-related protein n=1 Tax=Aromatoleum toluclasticum TaxID=92003 RepID=UPI001D1977C5|nr:YCF48-related protein [Aromatoleum toluclasticum]MCC4114716.1 YCF48-related protein [Aromatoleum toluclasticum]